MTLTRIALAWVAASLILLAWAAGRARLAGGDPPPAPARLWKSPCLGVYLGEAALLVLLAALWFGSLGHGGWPLLFFLLGILLEWRGSWAGEAVSVRRRTLELAGGTVRTMLVGGVLSWMLP